MHSACPFCRCCSAQRCAAWRCHSYSGSLPVQFVKILPLIVLERGLGCARVCDTSYTVMDLLNIHIFTFLFIMYPHVWFIHFPFIPLHPFSSSVSNHNSFLENSRALALILYTHTSPFHIPKLSLTYYIYSRALSLVTMSVTRLHMDLTMHADDSIRVCFVSVFLWFMCARFILLVYLLQVLLCFTLLLFVFIDFWVILLIFHIRNLFLYACSCV